MAKIVFRNRWLVQHGGSFEPRFWFKQRFEHTDRTFNITSVSYDLEINQNRLRGSLDFLEDIKVIWDECLAFAIEHHGPTARQGRFCLTSSHLTQAVNLPYVPIDDLTSDKIFKYISNLAQSNEAVFLADKVNFHFQFADF